MHPIVNIGVRAARRAGNIILQGMNNLETVAVYEKQKNDYVSSIDKSSEKAIIEVIRAAYPEHAIIAEESGVSEGAEYTWIIDPLDGTTNFLHNFPHFAVSIGVLHKGELAHAVVYDPYRDELFTATAGQGAMLNQRRLRLKNSVRLDGALIGTGFPYSDMDYIERYLTMFRAVCPRAAGIRRAGSAALDLAYVAAGRLDGFWEIGLKPWDVTAGALLIREAGGMVSDFKGTDAFLRTGDVVAGSPKVYSELHPIIAGCFG